MRVLTYIICLATPLFFACSGTTTLTGNGAGEDVPGASSDSTVADSFASTDASVDPDTVTKPESDAAPAADVTDPIDATPEPDTVTVPDATTVPDSTPAPDVVDLPDASPSDTSAPDAADPTSDASLSDTGGPSPDLDVAAQDADAPPSMNDASSDDDVEVPLSGPFRPRSPLSTARSTSNRPLFRVVLTDDLDAAQITLCAEVACDTVLLTFETDGAEGTSPEPLPAGPVYWYAEGMSGGVVVTEPSYVWQLHIPAHPAPHGTAWGTTFDLELDGLADVLIGACGFANPNDPMSGCTELVGMHRGGNAGPSPVPADILTDPQQLVSFGFSVGSAGDVNGDGLPDVVVGAGLGDSAHVFLNSPEGLIPEPVQSWFVAGAWFGFNVASAGDVNGDGYGDVIVGSMLGFSAFLYYGGPDGPGSGPNTALSTGAFGLGVSVSSAGDVNGDSYEDLIIGAANGIPPEASIWYGGPDGPPTVPDLVLTGSGTFGISARGAGDINGDGYADVVVGAGDASYFVVHMGGPDGVNPDPSLVGVGGASFGISVAGAGDVNGDGYGDVIVGGSGTAWIYHGDFGGLMPEAATKLYGSNGTFGNSVACLGDTNGDGFDDVGVGATSLGLANAYLGSEDGITEEEVVTMTGGLIGEEETPVTGYGMSVGNSVR